MNNVQLMNDQNRNTMDWVWLWDKVDFSKFSRIYVQ